VQSNWSSIWDLLHDLSDATGFHAWLGPRAGTLNFSATRGTDLSATIKFAEGRNISTYRHTRNLLEKVDRVWVIGAQVGEEQVYGVKATDPLPTNYRERVFSAKSISDPIVLQTLAETLYTVLNSAIEQITLTVRDGYATGAYDVGDTVQIDIPSKSVSGKYRILNISRTFQSKAETVSIDVASPGVIALRVIEQILTQSTIVADMLLQKKVRDLEVSV
jgi:hypothetical protein